MGESAAREFVLQGGILDAAGAVRKGLATEAVPHEKLPARVLEFATELAFDDERLVGDAHQGPPEQALRDAPS